VIRTLRVATFNAENFYLLLDAPYERSEIEALPEPAYRAMNPSIFNPNKERSKIAAIADFIREGNFDIVGLCEVGGRETLEHLNRAYLEGRYQPFIHEENSRRGIFVGALVRHGVFETVSAASVGAGFSRNLLRLRLCRDGTELTVYVVHLKSQLGEDRGIGKRLEEVQTLAATVETRACVVMGDFNGIAIRGMAQFEFEAFLELPFRDVLEAMDVPEAARFTHYYFSRGRESFNQLDYLFCSNDLPVRDGGVAADFVPLNYEQRRRLPSDHAPLWAELELDQADAPTRDE